MAQPAPIPPPPQPDPEKHRDRIVTWRAAILTTIAGLVVGAISAGSAIAGVIITSNNEAEQAREEFLRTQRQAVYVQFLQAYDDLLDDVIAMENEEYSGIPPAVADGLVTDLDGVESNLTALELLASTKTGSLAQAMLDDLAHYVYQSVEDYCAYQIPAPPAEACSGPPPPPQSGSGIQDPRSAFLKSVRTDLGAE